MALYPSGIPLTEIQFEEGDMFVVEGKATISSIIRYFTKGLASHAGLITDRQGNTIESLKTIREAHISDYIGQNVVIVRPKVHPENKRGAVLQVKDRWLGRTYPWWRFVPHLLSQVLPFMGKVNLIGIPVCSELVAYAEAMMGIRSQDDIWGTNPDDLMDQWNFSSKHQYVYRGRLVG